MKLIKKGIMLGILCLFCTVLLPTKASALQWNQMRVEITTVIDNIAECPQAQNMTFNYTMMRIWDFYRYGRDNVDIPRGNEWNFNFSHQNTTNVILPGLAGNSYSVALLAFKASSTTNSHISLSSIELTDNVKNYTYTSSGDANPSAEAFNWVEVVDSTKGPVRLTLHFRYNPDIGEIEDTPDPNPSYTKQIDYLGDSVSNPDTTAHGENDYRLYLSLTTEKPQEAEADKDVIFLLDISNSMKESLGSSTRLDEMKKTVNSAIDVLTANSENRISIISFESYVRLLVSNSSNADELKSAVRGMQLPGSSGGGTNYYNGLTQVANVLNGLIDPDRETVVFFLTDGQPTACLPAVQAIGYEMHAPIALLYAAYAAGNLPVVDRFYSVFIGDNEGNASTLQTITQKVPVRIEKYMIQATSAEQLQNTFSRFLSRVDKSLYDVTIEDELSEYVDYQGASKVCKISGDGTKETLVPGIDYSLTYNNATRKVTMKLLKNTTDSSQYVLSFNVRSNDAALAYYDQHQSFPHVGDIDTDYPGNTTSSGQPGFYSNNTATLTYSFSGGQTVTKTYSKPVVQVVEPDAVPMEIEARKILNGKTLEAGMFEFELTKDTESGEVVVATATNDADGKIVFGSAYVSRAGVFTYHLKEKVPDVPEPGMTYDDTVIEVEVTVTRGDNGLVVSSIVYRDPEDPVFVNEYEPQPVQVILEAKKVLEGRTLTDGEFQFKLLTGNNVEIETTGNKADGTVTFAPLKFTSAGTYVYLIRESVPRMADRHITYDLKTVTATIEVTDNNGVLEAAVTYSPENKFVNKFSYAPASATIQLKKVLTGMQLTTGMFEFELKDLSGGGTTKTSNLSNGDILFDKTFNTPGVYQYEVREIKPSTPMKYMTYDDKVITVMVSVTDDGTGDLTSTVTYSEDAVFYNSYKVRGGIW